MTADLPDPHRAAPRSVWTRARWQALRAAHAARVDAAALAFVERRARGLKHPVEDFLFTYYTLSPARLRQWTPPWGAAIEVEDADLEAMPWLAGAAWQRRDGLLSHAQPPPEPRRRLAAWVAELCARVRERPARFGCLGLHEWAMVYRQSRELVRHQSHELRLPPEALAAFVEAQTIGCSHYDAYRFFTPAARPLNTLNPTLETRPRMEQAGCLHANMDLYKWSAKLLPWAGSDLIGRCFELARRARLLDMRASPYDLRALGLEPVRIETPEGRALYEQEQRALAAESAPLREALRAAAESVAASE
ncbi:MAG TPA: hypothetical protein DIT64_16165 [Verrucomicrobiales bacterium]|nr:hypothetical protein [Verrucomicrobiales bacterium]